MLIPFKLCEGIIKSITTFVNDINHILRLNQMKFF